MSWYYCSTCNCAMTDDPNEPDCSNEGTFHTGHRGYRMLSRYGAEWAVRNGGLFNPFDAIIQGRELGHG